MKATEKVVQMSTLIEKSTEGSTIFVSHGNEAPFGASSADQPPDIATIANAIENAGDNSNNNNDNDKPPLSSIPKSALAHFPDIKLPGEQTRTAESTENKPAAANGRFQLTPVLRQRLFLVSIIVLFGVLALGANWLSERSKSEKAFRHYVNEAQLAQVSFDNYKQVAAWRGAIAEATKLGDSPKALGDLYMELSKSDYLPKGIEHLEEPKLTIDPQVHEDLRRALALYKKEPYTQLQQIIAIERLYYGLPLEQDPLDYPVAWSNTKQALKEARQSLRQGKITRTAKIYADIEISSQGRFREEGEQAEVETFLRKHVKSSRIEDVMPLASAMLQWSVKSSLEDQVSEAKYDNARIDDAIDKSGHTSSDYEFTKKLADSMFQKKDYCSATQAYWRCQAIKDTSGVRDQIRLCYLNQHHVTPEVAVEADQLMTELVELHKQAFGESSTEMTAALDLYAWECELTGNFDKAEMLRTAILARSTLEKVPAIRYSKYYTAMLDSDPKVSAQRDLLSLYTREGKFKEARAFYQRTSSKSNKLNRLDYAFIDLCSKANWLEDSAVRRLVALNRKSGN